MVATIKTDRIETALGKAVELTGQAAAKAWANIDGVTTAGIRDSMNISSVTDLGVGKYRASYTNAFATRDYIVGGSAALSFSLGDWGRPLTIEGNGMLAGSTILHTGRSDTLTHEDCEAVTTTTTGDLA